MMMVTIPVFMPVIHASGLEPVWFAVLFLLNTQFALITPPFGINLFVMKSVAMPDTTMWDIIRAGLPFIGLIAVGMSFLIAFPEIALWLPSQIR